MKATISRRDFLKYSAAGVVVLVVGSKLSWLRGGQAFAATQTIDFHIGDALKNMHTHNASNSAQCYFWIYKSVNPAYAPECPGPIIVAAHGDTIDISVTNELDEPHAFYIPGMVDSGEIAPGATWTGSFTASILGGHLYYDNLNEPVNRMMGLHGALIVMPTEDDRNGTHKLTPYGGLPADHGVQRLYDDFGSAHLPGLAWEQGDNTPWAMDPTFVNTPPFRQYVWLLHQASPRLFAEVGNLPAGQLYDPQQFLDKFLRAPFVLNNNENSHSDRIDGCSYIPQYFTINGQSGFFAHFNPYVTMMGRVGEPCVVHILNAGLWTHSMHLHANHFWVTSVNGAVNPNPIWLDVFRVDPMDRIDYTVPFMRPPDVGHPSGIGLPETPLTTANGHPVWPPIEEFEMYMPPLGTKALNAAGAEVELGQRMSPLCFPMHDHSEPSQTSQGGNYNTGLISGIYFTGDRNTPGHFDFPMDEDFHMAFQNIRGCSGGTERAAPVIGEPHH
ncbi:MAG: multicopper oxidase domain-containing protein [Chloroflexi bacterium]|nr:multicopper oxidase domain-containing protein [Chloroflexota bacterium]